jgi:hypothetical protein
MPESLTVLIRQPSLYSLHDLTDNYPRVDLWLPVHGGSCASARLDVQELDNPQVVCGKCNETHTVTYTMVQRLRSSHFVQTLSFSTQST